MLQSGYKALMNKQTAKSKEGQVIQLEAKCDVPLSADRKLDVSLGGTDKGFRTGAVQRYNRGAKSCASFALYKETVITGLL